MITRNSIPNSVSKGFTKAPKKKKYPKMGANKKMGYRVGKKNKS